MRVETSRSRHLICNSGQKNGEQAMKPVRHSWLALIVFRDDISPPARPDGVSSIRGRHCFAGLSAESALSLGMLR